MVSKRISFLFLILALLCVPSVRCAEPAKADGPEAKRADDPKPAVRVPGKGDPDGIRLPVLPVPPTPVPAAVTKLGQDQLFIVDADVVVTVLASPSGLVNISTDAGPLRIKGKFVDGTGKTETRTYKGKQVVTVEASGTGKVELLIIPTGATGEAVIIRRTLDVSGAGPTPPDPIPPDPIPVTDPLAKSLIAAYALDMDADKAKSLAFLQAAYSTMALGIKSQTTIKTNADAATWMKSIVEAPGAGLTAAQVVNLRKAVGTELSTAWGTTVKPMDLVTLAAELDKIATALKAVK